MARSCFFIFSRWISPSQLLLCDRMWKNCMCRNSSTHPRRQNKANACESFVAATQRQSTHFTASSMGPCSPSRTCNQKWTLHTKFCTRCPLYSASSFSELMGKTRGCWVLNRSFKELSKLNFSARPRMDFFFPGRIHWIQQITSFYDVEHNSMVH